MADDFAPCPECGRDVWTVVFDRHVLELHPGSAAAVAAEALRTADVAAAAEIDELVRHLDAVPVTTTPSFEPTRRIGAWLGPVFGEAVLGANVFSDIAASVRDVVGGRSESYEKQLARGRLAALDALKRQAVTLGGNAVVGVRVDYEALKGTMLMVTAQGTAVRTD